MKNSPKINNLNDLQAEIARLHVRQREQESYLCDQYQLLKNKVEAPFRLIRRITAHVPGAGMLKGVTSSISKAVQSKDADWLTRLLQVGAPIVLNSTLLRRAGWMKKALVLVASETAIGQVNQDKVSGLLNKVTAFLKPKKKKRKKKATHEDVLGTNPDIAIGPRLEDERYTGA